MIEGSSFSGLLTRIDIGHMRRRSVGNGRSNSRGNEEAPPIAPFAPLPVRIENNHTIEIERFVPRAQIDPRTPSG
jgi:hypothetical protein